MNQTSVIRSETEYGEYFNDDFPSWISVVLLVVGIIGKFLFLSPDYYPVDLIFNAEI
jgi:hypothetical protein